MDKLQVIVVGPEKISASDVVAISERRAQVALSTDQAWRRRIEKGAEFLERQWRAQKHVYGVTTGYGNSCTVSIPPELVEELPAQLTRFHGCGLGKVLSPENARAVLAVRLASFACGFSGVRFLLLERLADLLNLDIVPVIPEEGSVGASGDLTPLSYLAAVLMGEREVFFGGRRTPAKAALDEVRLEPIVLHPKEALAIMNGTAVMTALAVSALTQGEYLSRLAARLSALAVIALGGNESHYSKRLFEAKPHRGMIECAARIRCDLGDTAKLSTVNNPRLQDRYSLRCAPHVVGVLADALPWVRTVVETELNSANDNPLIDGETEEVLHGGHFYGGHIAFAMDSLKTAVANIADLLDRQLALLVDVNTNNGLPANLSGAEGSRAAINHGFKAVQIAVSAWTAEALKLTMPASVFSRSTESHNQDKVSMGTISSRDCLRVLELTHQVCASLSLACAQAIEIRRRDNELPAGCLTDPVAGFVAEVRRISGFLKEDRPLDVELAAVKKTIEERGWALYE